MIQHLGRVQAFVETYGALALNSSSADFPFEPVHIAWMHDIMMILHQVDGGDGVLADTADKLDGWGKLVQVVDCFVLVIVASILRARGVGLFPMTSGSSDTQGIISAVETPSRKRVESVRDKKN